TDPVAALGGALRARTHFPNPQAVGAAFLFGQLYFTAARGLCAGRAETGTDRRKDRLPTVRRNLHPRATDSDHGRATLAGDSEDRVGRQSGGRELEEALGRIGRSGIDQAANRRLRPRTGFGERLREDGAQPSSGLISSAATAGDVWRAVLPE